MLLPTPPLARTHLFHSLDSNMANCRRLKCQDIGFLHNKSFFPVLILYTESRINLYKELLTEALVHLFFSSVEPTKSIPTIHFEIVDIVI